MIDLVLLCATAYVKGVYALKSRDKSSAGLSRALPLWYSHQARAMSPTAINNALVTCAGCGVRYKHCFFPPP
jgi:hypothetical protein